MSITAAYNAAGDAITSNIPTEQLEIINIRSAQWPIDYRVGSGPWESIQEGKSRVVVADLSTQTVRLRRGLNASATLVVDLVLYAKPSGLKSGQGASVDIFTPAKVAAIDSLVSADGIPQALALLGDSIAAQNSGIVSGAYITHARGPVIWMLNYLGHPWDHQPTDNFAVGGAQANAVITDQLPLLLAAHRTRRYVRAFISLGTNDTNSARSYEDITADLLTICNTLRASGIIPVHTSILPRGADGAMTDAKRKNQRINEWLFVKSLTGLLEYIPCAEVYADNSTAFGNTLATMMYDSTLHPSARGAALQGKLMADYYTARGVGPNIVFATQQSDVFDRTNNPAGVAFNGPNPLLTGGTTTPTGMTVTGGTWSLGSRTLSNGQTRAVRSCALAASTLHHLYDDWSKTGNWLTTELQPGDIIEARAKIVITSGVNIQGLQLKLVENEGSNSLNHYGGYFAESASLQGNHTLYFKSPRIVVRDYFGSGNVTMFARMECQTDAGASGTYDVHAFEVRKVG